MYTEKEEKEWEKNGWIDQSDDPEDWKARGWVDPGKTDQKEAGNEGKARKKSLPSPAPTRDQKEKRKKEKHEKHEKLEEQKWQGNG